ncbi:hypothetical protein K0B03_01485 [Patescibacteria group bacterium]|nr:hypothetical protein [Patescibacteria group bacterium]
MFDKTKEKIKKKIKIMKKAAFLAFISYIYDKVANRKDKKKFIEDVEYKVEKKDFDKLK